MSIQRCAVDEIGCKVGGATACKLLSDGGEVRALVRDRARAGDRADSRVELLEGDLADAAALGDALQGIEGAFLMQPTPMGVSPGFPEATVLNASIKEALRRSPPPRLVVLSSVGSEQGAGLGNITQTHLLEKALSDLDFPIAVVRAGALIENHLTSLKLAAERACSTASFSRWTVPSR